MEANSLDAPVPQLNNESLLHLMSFFQPKELGVAARVCHKWNELSSSDDLWSRFLTKRGATVGPLKAMVAQQIQTQKKWEKRFAAAAPVALPSFGALSFAVKKDYVSAAQTAAVAASNITPEVGASVANAIGSRVTPENLAAFSARLEGLNTFSFSVAGTRVSAAPVVSVVQEALKDKKFVGQVASLGKGLCGATNEEAGAVLGMASELLKNVDQNNVDEIKAQVEQFAAATLEAGAERLKEAAEKKVSELTIDAAVDEAAQLMGRLGYQPSAGQVSTVKDVWEGAKAWYNTATATATTTTSSETEVDINDGREKEPKTNN